MKEKSKGFEWEHKMKSPTIKLPQSNIDKLVEQGVAKRVTKEEIMEEYGDNLKEESKYYTPEIEEFHVGFEYEHKNLPDGEDAEWFPHTFNKYCDAQVHNSMSRRVKHLDREDIESLGFITYENRPADIARGFRGFNKGDYHISTNEGSNRIHISKILSERSESIFNGTIKNKSELKRLLKQLGI